MPTPYAKIKERRENDPEYAARLRSYAEKYKSDNLEKEKERQRLVKLASRKKDREAYNAYMREWTLKNKDTINAKRRERRRSDPERAANDNERRRANRDPEMHRNTMLKNNYGITLNQYREMYADQQGKCAICGDERPDHGKLGLVVDHCHTHGNVRKLLCPMCNKGLGHFHDNVQILAKAIDYLQSSI